MTNTVGAGSAQDPEPAHGSQSQPSSGAAQTSPATASGTAGENAKKPRARAGGVLSGILTYSLVLVCALVPVPYLLQMPGPVVNTLEPVDGKDLITISGTETYEADGQLDMLTVAVAGGPGKKVYASEALRSERFLALVRVRVSRASASALALDRTEALCSSALRSSCSIREPRPA